VPKHLPEEIVAHLADIGAVAAQRGEPGHRVARRPARGLDCRSHHRVERLGPGRVDQGHRPFDERFPVEKPVIGVGDHIDDGIADADDIMAVLRHLGAMT